MYYSIMDGFLTIYKDLKNDLMVTFPELKVKLNDLSDNEVYQHCLTNYPSHFFDILYEKDSLFDSEMCLLPGIDFSVLMKDETISEKSRATLWKYLQLILFYTIEKTNTLDDSDSVHKKMEKTMEDMKEMFQQSDISNTFQNMFKDLSNDDFFNAEEVKNNLDNMMSGKIGSIAKEIAQETAKEFESDNPEDFMKNLMKDPSKIMGLVQNIGSKLEGKLKSHDLKDEDMMKEASDIMNQMNDIPGLKEMMSKMGMNGKMDMKGMMNKMEQTKKQNDTKERMRKKMEKNMEEKAMQSAMKKLMEGNVLEKNEEGNYVFKKEGEAPKKSKRKKNRDKKKE